MTALNYQLTAQMWILPCRLRLSGPAGGKPHLLHRFVIVIKLIKTVKKEPDLKDA